MGSNWELDTVQRCISPLCGNLSLVEQFRGVSLSLEPELEPDLPPYEVQHGLHFADAVCTLLKLLCIILAMCLPVLLNGFT